ncbi:hypothetical protein [Nonomuraea sp. NPDC049158]|uniref:glycoside hydrolase family 78 protein n=1 Tax=Nonomuraea sp. NPDC049158 TaxID=3155649 RepID=UPI0033C7A51B
MRPPATTLRVEHLDETLGIRVTQPRLSWRPPAGSAEQSAYRIRTSNGWDSGRISSAQSVLVPYAGPPLRSAEQVEWQVKVWTDTGESEWSAPAAFEMGLLAAADWQAEWIIPGPSRERRSGHPHLHRLHFHRLHRLRNRQ